MMWNLLYEVRVKWYALGIQLGITPGTLDAYRAQNSDYGDCLREMLRYWLSSKSHTATLETLLEALSSEPVGETVLAEKTRHIHLTLAYHKSENTAVV